MGTPFYWTSSGGVNPPCGNSASPRFTADFRRAHEIFGFHGDPFYLICSVEVNSTGIIQKALPEQGFLNSQRTPADGQNICFVFSSQSPAITIGNCWTLLLHYSLLAMCQLLLYNSHTRTSPILFSRRILAGTYRRGEPRKARSGCCWHLAPRIFGWRCVRKSPWAAYRAGSRGRWSPFRRSP